MCFNARIMARRHANRRWQSWSGRSWTGLSLTLLAAALWGLAPVATKAALDGFSPEFVGFVRLAVAALLFRFLAGKRASWFVADRWVWLAGAALAADFILYNYGMGYTSANVAGLVINVEMVSTIGFAVWLLGESLSARRAAGSVVTLAGVLLVSLDGLDLRALVDARRIVGNLLVMAAGISWSLFAVAQRRAGDGENHFERLTPIFSVAALAMLPSLLRRGAWRVTLDGVPTAMLIVLIIFGTVLVYWVYARAQQLIDVSVLAVLLCSIPIFTVVFAYALLGEPVTAHLIVGGVIVVAGIIVIATEPGGAPEATAALTGESSQLPAAPSNLTRPAIRETAHR